MNIIVKFLINAVSVFLCAYVLEGVHVDGFVTALLVAVLLGILNVLVKPILILLTLPITLLTLGLFLLVINALLILLAAAFVPGFSVDSLLWALLFSILLSVVNSFLQFLVK